MMDAIAGAVRAFETWLYTHFYELLTWIVGVWAAVVTATVLRRLESGGSRQVGRDIAGLAVLLAATVGLAYLAYAATDVTFEQATSEFRGWLAKTREAGGPSYLAAAGVLVAGWIIWLFKRSKAVDPAASKVPRAPMLLVVVWLLLLVVLWVVQTSVAPFAPQNPNDVRQVIATVTGAGLLAMAIVQGLRSLLPVRGIFHRAIIERWIDESLHPEPLEKPEKPKSRRPSVRQVLASLKGLFRREPSVGRQAETKQLLRSITTLARASSAGERYALLDLPIEQLCGQIAAGADRLLEDPASLPPEQRRRPAEPMSGAAAAQAPVDTSSKSADGTLATRPDRPPDVVMVLRVLAATGAAEVDKFLKLAAEVAASPLDAKKKKEEEEEEEEKARYRNYVKHRANLSQRIQRNIDRLQIETSFWWKRALRGLVFAICGVLGLSMFKDAMLALVCAVVGGFVAMATRDLIAVVEKARR